MYTFIMGIIYLKIMRPNCVHTKLSCSVSVCSDLAKRVEEEATGGEEGEGALEPEAQFSLDSLDIIKVAYQ